MSGTTPAEGGTSAPVDAAAAAESGIRTVWARLVPACAEMAGANPERVRGSTLSFDWSLAFAASTTQWRRGASVSVHAGILSAMIEVARIVASVSSNAGLADPAVTPADAVESAGMRSAFVLQWLTSVARHPVPLKPTSLGTDGEMFAGGLAIGAVAFVLAHELGHVALESLTSPASTAALELEPAADLWAVRLLRSLPAPPPLRTGETASLANVEISPDLTIPAAAVFLSFEGLRLRAVASHAAFLTGAVVPDSLTVVDITDTPTHPSPYRRLGWLRGDAVAADPDGTEMAGFDAVIAGFDALLPAIERNMPEHVLDDTERSAVAALPGSPPLAADYTWDDFYRTKVTGRLQDAARRGELTDDDITWLQGAVEAMPRTTLDVLADAVAGRMPDSTAPDAAEVARLAATLPARFANPLVRRAILSRQESA